MAIQALTEVSLSILPGQSMGVIGESGAGKTTLAALAAGLATPSSGRVLINGQRLSSGETRPARPRPYSPARLAGHLRLRRPAHDC